ncbi:MAG: S49 family peptidase [Gammaproteobacteria bacterium]|nr:S49 family peptidase [Gammaproteobacteria bacterium]
MNSNDQPTLENTLIQALLSEQKSTRRWKNIRFFVWLAVFLTLLFMLIGPSFSGGKTNNHDGKYISLVRLNGEIMAGSNFSARKVIPELAAAFGDKESKGVVLLINSPGGSPVQASLIHDKILQLKTKYHKQVIVVAEDTLASGAYLVATAADKIYVNADTVTGSIGVIMEGFGFSDVMKKIGISRRVFTAGTNKDRLDPFESVKPEDVAKVKKVLDAVHQDFIKDVTEGRKGKLNGDPAELFSGDFWTGSQAVTLGLADGTANIWDAAQSNFGTTHYRDYSPHDSFFENVMRNVSMKLPLGLDSHTKLQEVI